MKKDAMKLQQPVSQSYQTQSKMGSPLPQTTISLSIVAKIDPEWEKALGEGDALRFSTELVFSGVDESDVSEYTQATMESLFRRGVMKRVEAKLKKELRGRGKRPPNKSTYMPFYSVYHITYAFTSINRQQA